MRNERGGVLTQRADQIAGETFGFVLRRGTKHGLSVDLNFVAEYGILHPDAATVAPIDLECRHFENLTEQILCLDVSIVCPAKRGLNADGAYVCVAVPLCNFRLPSPVFTADK